MTTARDAVVTEETHGDEPAAEPSNASAKRLNFNVISAVLFVLFGIVLFLITPYQVEEPVVVFGQSLNALDPTLFPRVLAVGFFVLGIWYFIKSFGLRERNGFRDVDRHGYVNVLVSLVAFALYAMAMEPLGFVLSSVLLVVGLAFFYGARNPILIALVGIGVPVTVYMIFTRLLQVFLPEFPDV